MKTKENQEQNEKNQIMHKRVNRKNTWKLMSTIAVNERFPSNKDAQLT